MPLTRDGWTSVHHRCSDHNAVTACQGDAYHSGDLRGARAHARSRHEPPREHQPRARSALPGALRPRAPRGDLRGRDGGLRPLHRERAASRGRVRAFRGGHRGPGRLTGVELRGLPAHHVRRVVARRGFRAPELQPRPARGRGPAHPIDPRGDHRGARSRPRPGSGTAARGGLRGRQRRRHGHGPAVPWIPDGSQGGEASGGDGVAVPHRCIELVHRARACAGQHDPGAQDIRALASARGHRALRGGHHVPGPRQLGRSLPGVQAVP